MNGTDDAPTSGSTPNPEIRPKRDGESGPEPRLVRLRKRCRRWRHELLPSASYTRLGDSLKVSRDELESLISRQSHDAQARTFLNEAAEMLRNAQHALEREGNPELGWRWFKAASRLLAYAMPEKELLARARSILREACDEGKGVTSWRRATIKELLAGDDGNLEQNVKGHPDKVVYAAKILDEHHDNVYQKSAIIRGRLKVLAFVTVVALIVWVAVLPPAPPAGVQHLPESSRIFWLTVVVSGVIGAAISGFTSSIKGGEAKRIPLELDFSAVTFARLALGALSAVAVAACLSAGVLKLAALSYELMLAAAIISGFSERLLLRALESTDA